MKTNGYPSEGHCGMAKCRLSPDPNPRTCFRSLQGVQSSEGRLALPLMLHQLLPGPQARHTDRAEPAGNGEGLAAPCLLREGSH